MAILSKNRKQVLQEGLDRLEPAHQVVPWIVTLWNSVKGGQDVVSRMLKNVKVDFRSLHPRAFVFIRGIMTLHLNAHLVCRIVDLDDNEIMGARSYHWIKSRLNRKCMFQKILAIVADDWRIPNEEMVRQNNQLQESDGPAVERVVLPKKNLVKFFNRNTAARRLRLDQRGHHKLSEKKRQCIICYRMKNGKKKRMETTVKCSKCGVYLCTRKKLLPSGNIAQLSCWERHHTQARLTTFEFVCRNAVCGSNEEAGEEDSNARNMCVNRSEFTRVTRSRRGAERNNRRTLRRSLRRRGGGDGECN